MKRLTLFLLLLGACGDEPLTIGDACKEVGTAFCRRAGSCGMTTPQVECEFEMLRSCCADLGRCSEESRATQSEIDVCTDDIAVYPCSSLANGTAPTSCLAF